MKPGQEVQLSDDTEDVVRIKVHLKRDKTYKAVKAEVVIKACFKKKITAPTPAPTPMTSLAPTSLGMFSFPALCIDIFIASDESLLIHGDIFKWSMWRN